MQAFSAVDFLLIMLINLGNHQHIFALSSSRVRHHKHHAPRHLL
jgi:hypothetical protein